MPELMVLFKFILKNVDIFLILRVYFFYNQYKIMSNRIRLEMYLGNGSENHFSYCPKYSGNVVIECGYSGVQTGMEIKKKFFEKFFENKTYNSESINITMHEDALKLFKIDCPNATSLLFIKDKSLKKIELGDNENINEEYYTYIQKYNEGTEFASQVNCTSISKLYTVKYYDTNKHFIFSDDTTVNTCIEFMKNNGINFSGNNIKINNVKVNLKSMLKNTNISYISLNEFIVDDINAPLISEHTNNNDDLQICIKNMELKMNKILRVIDALYETRQNTENIIDHLALEKENRDNIQKSLDFISSKLDKLTGSK